MNSIGVVVRLTLFGSSHGPGVGAVLDGIPGGIKISEEGIQQELDLRRPSPGIGTERAEEDRVQVLAGLVNGMTTGGPMQFYIANQDKDSSKYLKFKTTPRPGHADYPALVKYGEGHDIRGGGQFSGRMTAPIVAAGAVAKTLLRRNGIEIAAYSNRIGRVEDEAEHPLPELLEARKNPVRSASSEAAALMEREILEAKEQQDSVGGVVRCLVFDLPVGVGEPFFDTLEGELSKMIFAIPGVKGIEFGSGFSAARSRGSQNNDPFEIQGDRVVTSTNHAGGVLGGLSNGMPLDLKVAFKPTASIGLEQESVDLEARRSARLKIEGRHDPCIVPRAVVVVEAAVALVLADLCMRGGYIAR